MDSALYIRATLFLGAVTSLLHILISLLNNRRPGLESVVNCVLNSSCIVAGLVLIRLAVSNPSPCPPMRDIALYVGIGGLATLWVSLQGAYRAVVVGHTRRLPQGPRT